MGKVFISYRRQDSAGYVRALYNELAQHFGQEQIFMDVDDIPLGTDFVSMMNRNLQDCTMMLVVIGPQWLNIRDSQGERRLDNPDDFVRLEVARAIKDNFDIIPVLVNGAAMPGENDLPDNLKPLSRRQALELDNKYYKHGIADLTAALEAHLGKPGHPDRQPPTDTVPPTAQTINKQPLLRILPAVTLLLGIGALYYWLTPHTAPDHTQNTPLNVNATAPAGFDCRKASTDVEDAICNDDETRNIDLALNHTFNKTIAQLPPSAQQTLEEHQKDWLKQRDRYIRQHCFNPSNQGQTTQCIRRYYQQRITALTRIPSNLLHQVNVFDPPTNVRATPNGDIICQIRQQQTITVYNEAVRERDGDQWYPTRACGNKRWGLIHESQISAIP
ncbi:MAG: hypothetical protein CSA79_00920 [Thiothrix nivea]|nr:MAG: hypothetical protein CSA79_00920 [Thiothrix nivea]